MYGETPKVINLEDYLIKPSDAEFIRREICVAEVISGDPTKIVGQTLTKTTDDNTNASVSSVECIYQRLKAIFQNRIYLLDLVIIVMFKEILQSLLVQRF